MPAVTVRWLLLALLLACGARREPPPAEVPVGVVGGAAGAATAPPPLETPKLPSAQKKKRPLTSPECDALLGRLHPLEQGEAMQFCRRAILSPSEIDCVVGNVTRVDELALCRDAD